MRPRIAPLWLGASLLVAGCGENTVVPNTIRVVVSTDLDIPTDIDELDIAGLRGGLPRFSQEYHDPNIPSLPGSLLLHNDQPFDDQGHEILTPIEIRVEGRLDGQLVISRRAELTFVTDRPVVLYLPLCSVCLNTPDCGEDTCVLGTCTGSYVSIDSLPEDDGTQPAESAECPSATTTRTSPAQPPSRSEWRRTTTRSLDP